MTIKTVLITGCSSGIGQALAQQYLQQGFLVYGSARRIEDLAPLSHERFVPLVMDVNQASDIEQAVTTIKERSGKLDCLINNAGYAAMGPVTELSTEALHKQFTTNVYAPIALARACLALLKASTSAQQPAQIINIGSVSGILTTPFSGAYCATKAALHSLSDALRMELKPFNIRVITVQPGAIQSNFGNNSSASLDGLIQEDSPYAAVKSHIEARANASQDNPTSAADFARIFYNKVNDSNKAVIRIGNGSTALPLMRRVLPLSLLDKILSKKFGLNTLS